MLSRVTRAAYRAQQLSFLVNSTVLQETARVLSRAKRPDVDERVIRELRDRYRALLARDLANVEAGHYPRSLLFQLPARDYARKLPALLLDGPRVVRRMKANAYRDLPATVDIRSYPPYYRRTFHWQTDGYLSRRSAELYDVGVELLFRGTADVMRRQVIPPITRFLRGQDPADVRVLDVACGTGRTLAQLATAHPKLRYHGVDLSPFYVQAARELLAGVDNVAVLAENAESLPFVDNHFDVVTSVYLFHELPLPARRRVLAEMFRVLRPGGLLVLQDSAQPSESPVIAEVLAQFPRDFHEPFYDDYLKHDLGDLATDAGFELESVDPVMVAKLVVAKKPAS